MHAIAVGVAPASGCPIDWNADRFEKNAVRGAGGHGGNEWHAGKVFGDQFLRRADDLGIERWGHRERVDRRNESHLHPGIADRRLESGLSAFDRLTREYTAVDVRRGTLRQRVVGVAAFQQCSDTGRTEYAVIDAILG